MINGQVYTLTIDILLVTEHFLIVVLVPLLKGLTHFSLLNLFIIGQKNLKKISVSLVSPDPSQ